MAFRNAILAGLTLIREAIRSQNYVAGSSGWSIEADGTAEFADLSIRSSDGSGATVEIANGVVTASAANGWQIILDPTQTLPVIYFLDGDGDEAGALNATGDNTRAGVNLSSGEFTEGIYSDRRWVLFMGQTAASNAAAILRTRDSDPNFHQGGWFFLDGDAAQIGIQDHDTPANNILIDMDTGLALLDDGRLYVSAPPSAQPAFRVDVPDAGHTGWLLHLQREGSAKVTIDTNGELTTAGDIQSVGTLIGNELDIADTTMATYTPVVAGGGAATFTTASGEYWELGDLVWVSVYFVIGVAGSGASNVTFTLPSTPVRAGRRQNIPGGIRDGGVAGAGPVAALVFAGGAGAMVDRIVNSAGTDVTGALLTAGSVWTFNGWYRKV